MAKKRSKTLEDEVQVEEAIGDQPNDKKKGRGTSKLYLPRNGEQPKDLKRNKYGQPVGDESVDLSTYLGRLVKEFVPYTLDRWEDVDEDALKRMWCLIKLKFRVEDWERKATFQHVDKLWHDQKSRLRTNIRMAHESNGSNDFSHLKPDFMNQNQWDLFVTKTFSPEFQEKSDKFSKMCAKKTMNHTMGREGYARLEEKMNEKNTSDTEVTRVQVWLEGHKVKNKQPTSQHAQKMKDVQECPVESQHTTSINEDAISLVFGKEARGRVRGLGFGVTPSKVGVQVQMNASVKQLQGDIRTMKQEFDEMKSMLLQVLRQPNLKEQVPSDCAGDAGNEVVHGGAKAATPQVPSDGVGDAGNEVVHGGAKAATPQENCGSLPNRKILENTKCKLLHWSVGGKVVAEGRIASTNPEAKVHHVPLGPLLWKVWIDRVIVGDIMLIQPNEEMYTLDHALGSTTAWLKQLITLDD